MEAWREFRNAEWEGIKESTRKILEDREAVGRRDYGSGGLGGRFRGDPVTHLEDEIGDSLAYLYFIRRQREYLEEEVVKRDALLQEGRGLAIAARLCQTSEDREAFAERLRDWEKRAGEVIQPPD